jgi:peroxiredoxin family protein
MKEMFEYSLCRTYELLHEQMQQARRSGNVKIKACYGSL